MSQQPPPLPTKNLPLKKKKKQENDDDDENNKAATAPPLNDVETRTATPKSSSDSNDSSYDENEENEEEDDEEDEESSDEEAQAALRKYSSFVVSPVVSSSCDSSGNIFVESQSLAAAASKYAVESVSPAGSVGATTAVPSASSRTNTTDNMTTSTSAVSTTTSSSSGVETKQQQEDEEEEEEEEESEPEELELDEKARPKAQPVRLLYVPRSARTEKELHVRPPFHGVKRIKGPKLTLLWHCIPCRYGDNCIFKKKEGFCRRAHTQEELRCAQYALYGACSNGDSCRLKHSLGTVNEAARLFLVKQKEEHDAEVRKQQEKYVAMARAKRKQQQQEQQQIESEKATTTTTAAGGVSLSSSSESEQQQLEISKSKLEPESPVDSATISTQQQQEQEKEQQEEGMGTSTQSPSCAFIEADTFEGLPKLSMTVREQKDRLWKTQMCIRGENCRAYRLNFWCRDGHHPAELRCKSYALFGFCRDFESGRGCPLVHNNRTEIEELQRIRNQIQRARIAAAPPEEDEEREESGKFKFQQTDTGSMADDEGESNRKKFAGGGGKHQKHQQHHRHPQEIQEIEGKKHYLKVRSRRGGDIGESGESDTGGESDTSRRSSGSSRRSSGGGHHGKSFKIGSGTSAIPKHLVRASKVGKYDDLSGYIPRNRRRPGGNRKGGRNPVHDPLHDTSSSSGDNNSGGGSSEEENDSRSRSSKSSNRSDAEQHVDPNEEVKTPTAAAATSSPSSNKQQQPSKITFSAYSKSGKTTSVEISHEKQDDNDNVNVGEDFDDNNLIPQPTTKNAVHSSGKTTTRRFNTTTGTSSSANTREASPSGAVRSNRFLLAAEKQLYKTEFCPSLHFCREYRNYHWCDDAHNLEELRCPQFALLGKCPRGENCPAKHSRETRAEAKAKWEVERKSILGAKKARKHQKITQQQSLSHHQHLIKPQDMRPLPFSLDLPEVASQVAQLPEWHRKALLTHTVFCPLGDDCAPYKKGVQCGQCHRIQDLMCPFQAIYSSCYLQKQQQQEQEAEENKKVKEQEQEEEKQDEELSWPPKTSSSASAAATTAIVKTSPIIKSQQQKQQQQQSKTDETFTSCPRQHIEAAPEISVSSPVKTPVRPSLPRRCSSQFFDSETGEPLFYVDVPPSFEESLAILGSVNNNNNAAATSDTSPSSTGTSSPSSSTPHKRQQPHHHHHQQHNKHNKKETSPEKQSQETTATTTTTSEMKFVEKLEEESNSPPHIIFTPRTEKAQKEQKEKEQKEKEQKEKEQQEQKQQKEKEQQQQQNISSPLHVNQFTTTATTTTSAPSSRRSSIASSVASSTTSTPSAGAASATTGSTLPHNWTDLLYKTRWCQYLAACRDYRSGSWCYGAHTLRELRCPQFALSEQFGFPPVVVCPTTGTVAASISAESVPTSSAAISAASAASAASSTTSSTTTSEQQQQQQQQCSTNEPYYGACPRKENCPLVHSLGSAREQKHQSQRSTKKNSSANTSPSLSSTATTSPTTTSPTSHATTPTATIVGGGMNVQTSSGMVRGISTSSEIVSSPTTATANTNEISETQQQKSQSATDEQTDKKVILVGDEEEEDVSIPQALWMQYRSLKSAERRRLFFRTTLCPLGPPLCEDCVARRCFFASTMEQMRCPYFSVFGVCPLRNCKLSHITHESLVVNAENSSDLRFDPPESLWATTPQTTPSFKPQTAPEGNVPDLKL